MKQINGPFNGVKGTTWEGGIHVPFLVQWKGKLPAGKVYDQPVIQLDFLPTALSAAEVPIQPNWKLDGINLLPYLRGEKSGSPHAALYWRFGGSMAIRMGDWKLVKTTGGRGNADGSGATNRRDKATALGAELYNLREDIGEQNNVAASQPDKAKELAAAWQKWNSELIDPLWGAPIRAKKK